MVHVGVFERVPAGSGRCRLAPLWGRARPGVARLPSPPPLVQDGPIRRARLKLKIHVFSFSTHGRSFFTFPRFSLVPSLEFRPRTLPSAGRARHRAHRLHDSSIIIIISFIIMITTLAGAIEFKGSRQNKNGRLTILVSTTTWFRIRGFRIRGFRIRAWDHYQK